MTPTDLTRRLAAERARDFQRYAARSRLIALAHCCRPSRFPAALAALTAATRHHRANTPTTCCA